MKKYKPVKREIRILGIDDGPFDKFSDNKCLVVATIFRGGNYMDGLLSCYVKVDGDDSTEKLINIITKTKHYDQLNCIMINGISLGGFNVIDIKRLYKETKLPVIVVIRRMPDIKRIKEILKKINKKGKIHLINKAGKVFKMKIKSRELYFQLSGISKKRAIEIIKISTTHASIPEPIRIAHIIASGIIKGESKGSA